MPEAGPESGGVGSLVPPAIAPTSYSEAIPLDMPPANLDASVGTASARKPDRPPDRPLNGEADMNLASIMTRHVVCVGMDDTVRRVQQLFDQYKFHHLIVVDPAPRAGSDEPPQGQVVGMVTDRDLLHALSPFLHTGAERPLDRACLDRHVHQIMTRRVTTAPETMPVEEATLLVLQHGLTALPVLDAQGHCTGIVTWHDLLRWCLHGGCDPNLRANAA
jgi:acetoin utilization protein AcuB